MDAALRKGHPSKWSLCLLSWFWISMATLVVLGAIVVFAIIEVYLNFVSSPFFLHYTLQMCIAAWITAKYNANHNFPNSGLRARVRYILFVSIWTILFGSVYIALFISMAGSWMTGLASHFVLYVSIVLRQCHLIHLLFQFVCNLGILVGGGGSAYSIPRRSAWLSYPDWICILRTPERFVRFCVDDLVRAFFLPALSHKQLKLIIVYRVVLTFVFLFVIIQGIMRMRRGEGVATPMVEVWAKGKRSMACNDL